MSDQIPPDALLVDLPEPMPALAHALRALVKHAEPEAIEAVRPGWRVIGYDIPLGPRRRAYFAWIMAQHEHVHLGFPRGVLLRDPAGVLDGAGVTKLARWVTVRSTDDIDVERFEQLVHEAAAAALIPQGGPACPVAHNLADGPKLGQSVVHGARRPVHTETASPCSPFGMPSPLSMWATTWQPTKNWLRSAGLQSPTWTTTVRSAGGGPQVQNELWPE